MPKRVKQNTQNQRAEMQSEMARAGHEVADSAVNLADNVLDTHIRMRRQSRRAHWATMHLRNTHKYSTRLFSVYTNIYTYKMYIIYKQNLMKYVFLGRKGEICLLERIRFEEHIQIYIEQRTSIIEYMNKYQQTIKRSPPTCNRADKTNIKKSPHRLT